MVIFLHIFRFFFKHFKLFDPSKCIHFAIWQRWTKPNGTELANLQKGIWSLYKFSSIAKAGKSISMMIPSRLSGAYKQQSICGVGQFLLTILFYAPSFFRGPKFVHRQTFRISSPCIRTVLQVSLLPGDCHRGSCWLAKTKDHQDKQNGDDFRHPKIFLSFKLFDLVEQ